MIFYDLETTGIDVIKDRIIEIFALKINGEEKTELHHFVNPGIPIPKEASDVHGYTDEFVKDKPQLKDIIAEINTFFEGEDLVGYNNKKFDNLLLNMEFKRHGLDFKLNERNVIDVYEMWGTFEPRTLAGAYKRFCNKSSENLHGAKEDIKVMAEILEEMKNVFGLKEKTTDEISKLASPDKNSLCFGKLLIDDQNNLVINFGKKHSGKTVAEIKNIDEGYLQWLMNATDMDSAIKYYVSEELTRLKSIKA